MLSELNKLKFYIFVNVTVYKPSAKSSSILKDMKRVLILCTLIISIFVSNQAQAQPAVGSLAADWTYKDINNVTHHLYDYLDSGYMVILDISATWCSPCWAFHNSHIADSLTKHYGPNGTIIPKKMKFIFIEGDRFTNNADLHGNTSASQGDWTAGVNYPVIDTSGLNIANDVDGYPTFIAICPNKRVVFGNAGNSQVAFEPFWVNLMNNCPTPSPTKDAALLSTEDTVNLCANTVILQNMWNQPLTSATVEMYNGAALVASQPWTGSLQPFGVTGISFPAGSPANGHGNLKFRLNVPGDVNTSNDSVSSGFVLGSLPSNKIRVVLRTDRYPYEDSWTLYDGSTVIAFKEYGFADTNHVFTYEYTVNSGACLRFALHDVYEDGISGGTSFTTLDDGYLKLYDAVNNTLLDSVSGKGFSTDFIRHYRAAGTPNAINETQGPATLEVFPNPANDQVTIALGGLNAKSKTLTISDITGRVHLRVTSGEFPKGDQMQLNVRDWPTGFYFVTLQSESSRIVRKLQLIH